MALGASTLQEFSLALLVGLISGAYSSVFVAAPIVAYLKEREPRHRDVRIRLAQRGIAEGGGTMLLDPREISGMGVTRPSRRGSSKQSAAAVGGKASTGKASTAKAARGKAPSDTAPEGIVTDTVAERTAPAGAIPPRPRKKKRR